MLLFFVFFAPLFAQALTCTALTGVRNWNLAATWTSGGNCNRIPLAADDVIIPNAANISLDNATSINSLNVQNGGILNLGTTGNAMPTVAGAKTFGATSTVHYDGNVQNVTAETYGNLTLSRISGNRTKTAAGGTFTIAGDFTINTNTTWNANTNDPDVNIAGNITRVGTFTSGSGVYTFNGSGTQTISAAVTITNVTITNVSAQGLSLVLTHTFTNLTLNASAVLTLAGTTTAFPTNTTRALDATSNVRFTGSGAQTIPAYTYGNLETATGGTKTPAAGTHVIAGNLTIGASTTWGGNTNNPTVSIAGDFVNAGTAFNSGTNPYTFNGTAAQSFTGASTFTNITINSSAPLPDPVLNLNNDLTVSGNLTITFGGFVTGANKVVMLSGSSVVGASAGTGWIIGNLQKFIPAGASTTTFEVGTLGLAAPALAYAPASLTFAGVGGAGGSIIVSVTDSDHPQITTSGLDSSESVNRYWNLTVSGVTGTALPAFTNYSATLNFIAADLDGGANTNNFFVTRWTGSAWAASSTGTRTATSTQGTGLTALGELAIGETAPPTLTKTSVTFSDPINNTANPKAIPGAIKQFDLLTINQGLAIDSNTFIVTEVIDPSLAMYVDTIGGSGPVVFIQGTPTSGLTYTYTSLASGTDDLEFSNDGGATWTYTPTIGADGCDTAVTHVRINPQGSFATAASVSPRPRFNLQYRTCIK